MFFRLLFLPAVLFLVISTVAAEKPKTADHEGGTGIQGYYERAVIGDTYSFRPYPDSRQAMVNSILQTIAEGSGKLRAFTSYSVELEILYAVKAEAGSQPGLAFSIAGINFQGDTGYRDFDLSHLLTPDKADLVLSILSGDGEKIAGAVFRELDVDTEASCWFEVSLPRGSYTAAAEGGYPALYAVIDEAELYYDTRTLERINNFGEALAEYYQAPVRIMEAYELIGELDPGDPENLLLDEFNLCQAETLAAIVAQGTFHEWLNLEQSDPERVLEKHWKLMEEITDLRGRFNASIAAIDRLFYDKGEAVAGESPERAVRLFHSAITYNPFHIPSHLAIAGADLDANRKIEAIERLGEVFSLMNPYGIQLEEASLLADSVTGAFFDSAREYIGEQRFTTSVELLENAVRFCKLSSGLYECSAELRDLLVLSHRGIYGSFLVVSSRAIRNDDLRLARIYINSALEYQENNIDFIPPGGEALDLLFRVFTRHRVLHDLFGMFDNTNGAHEHVVAVREIAQQSPGLFDHILENEGVSGLQSAVLNYSAAGMPEYAVTLLKELQQKGIRASETAFQQRIAGRYAAEELRGQAIQGGKTPEHLLEELTGGDPWFSIYEHSFLSSW